MFFMALVGSCLIAGKDHCTRNFCIPWPIFHSPVSTMFAVSDLQRVHIGSGKHFIATTKSCTYVQTSRVVWEMTHCFGSLASGFAELSSWLGQEYKEGEVLCFLRAIRSGRLHIIHLLIGSLAEFLLASNFHGFSTKF